jgi:hypothetical protein
MTHKTVFKFIDDPGHGWLLVTEDQLAEAGLGEADITPFSYRSRAGVIALEEDCDAPRFLDAWAARHGAPAFDEEHQDPCPIRGWPGFGTRPSESAAGPGGGS